MMFLFTHSQERRLQPAHLKTFSCHIHSGEHSWNYSMSCVHDDEGVGGIMLQIQYSTHQGAEIGGHFPNQTWSWILVTHFYPQLWISPWQTQTSASLSVLASFFSQTDMWWTKQQKQLQYGRNWRKMMEQWNSLKRSTGGWGPSTMVTAIHLWILVRIFPNQ